MASPFMTGPFVPVAMLNLIRAVLGIHHHRFNLSVKRSSPSGPNEELFGGAPKLPGCAAYKRVPSLLVLTSWGRPSPVNVQLRSHLALYGLVTSTIGRMPPTPRNCWPM